MPAYAGKFQYLDESGSELQQGPCQLSFDEETCILTPASGSPLAFDLGDVDRAVLHDWDIQLALYTGKVLNLRQFGAAFGRMSDELLAAWRDRTVQCLLLEDLEEVARFHGTAAPGAAAPLPSEIRLFKSNLAVLPMQGAPLQWRLAEVDSVTFDQAGYSVTLQSGAERLIIAKLAKKTDEFLAKLRESVEALRTHSAAALRQVFPFLNADQLQRVVMRMPEGRSVRLAALSAIHSKIPDALIARAVDEPLKPYVEELRARAAADSLMAGFKFLRKDEAESTEEPGEAEEKDPLFFWFFFPIAGKDVVAWEASTGSGRATYFFRAPRADTTEAAVGRLTRGLALVNFRREPVYLSGESLEREPRYHRYAIGCRKLSDLRDLRSSMLGRAIHSSVEAWRTQIESILR